MPTRTASLIRAAGAGLAATRDRALPTAAVAAASYSASWRVDRAGIQVLSVSLPAGSPGWVQALNEAMASCAWAAANVGVDAALRAARVPALLRGVAVGGLVYAADTALAAKVEEALAAREKATPAPE